MKVFVNLRLGKHYGRNFYIGNMAKVAIIGVGYVGQAMMKIFPDAYAYDPPKDLGDREGVNACDLAIVCVPTPPRENGLCDTDLVEESVLWIDSPLILIKSTVEPGTTERLKTKYKKRVIFSPEYIGEGKYWTPPQYPDPENPLTHGFMILGGDARDCSEIADIFVPKVGPATRIRIMPSLEAELVKYFENTWGAMKVSMANEFREICEAVGANWHYVREGWLDDPRVEPMHTAVFRDKRGFDGKCFPKDTRALYEFAKREKYRPRLLETMLEANDERV